MSFWSRRCYKNGNANNIELVEIHALCECEKCKRRYNWKHGMRNQLVLTMEHSRLTPEVKDKIIKELTLWRCGEEKEVPIRYIHSVSEI